MVNKEDVPSRSPVDNVICPIFMNSHRDHVLILNP